MAKLIRNWADLDGLETDNYKIEVNLDVGCGWLRAKDSTKPDRYLTTHTFYESAYKGYTKLLREHGFDIELVSWG